MDSAGLELEGDYARMLFSSLLLGISPGFCIRIEKELVYLWDVNTWIPISVDDVVSVTVFPYAELAMFSLKDEKANIYVPLMNSGLSLKDLEDYFGKKLLVEESKFSKGGTHGDIT